uniref:RXYLT1 C-terminal domain-containing protein n=1 Tax=Noctiluca scintillans TaxID=2966 RepID=A0A7S1AX30_NOCSC|eukprot:CAMPEP_0194498560 /NCGR_PEP_ID=MMETSP0253-20130528/15150_1 /TAXON_ID=2966 /ORGANISM="Noctiluca scintillans" /LENGTH=451 /DNA_ID=CAMNT_0039340217 /DNA_START=103 /DNA_END=1458 /DNA_ORIENTATION=+
MSLASQVVWLCLCFTLGASLRIANEGEQIITTTVSTATHECLNGGSRRLEELFRGRADKTDEKACEGGSYPRSCLSSNIPLATSYATIRSCFRCCLFVWTRKLGLDKNLEHFRDTNQLNDESGKNNYEHRLTEVFLTPNTLMKFAHVAFTNKLFFKDDEHNDNPSGLVAKEGKVLLDRDEHQRPCTNTRGNQCVIPDGGVVLMRKFYYDKRIFENLGDWSVAGKNLTVLFDRDVLKGPQQDWKVLEEQSGLRVMRTNPAQESFLFPKAEGNKISSEDREFYPLGMSPNVSPRIHNFLLLQLRKAERPKPNLLFCNGIKTDGEPHFVWKHREDVLKLVGSKFACGKQVHLTPTNYYEALSDAKFALSPRGNGYNCFRTWEALSFGAIPVVDYHPAHEELYRHLPVVQVKDWNEVTPQFLESEWKRITAPRVSNLAKAFLPYWINEVFQNMQD